MDWTIVFMIATVAFMFVQVIFNMSVILSMFNVMGQIMEINYAQANRSRWNDDESEGSESLHVDHQ